MKTLIIYASKYGCTADCAADLKDKLTSDVTLIEIDEADNQIELETFDTVIIGGSIYAGQMSKKLRMFCSSNIETLCKKRIGLFLCCADIRQVDKFFETNFPAKLLEHAEITKNFGSEARLDKMKFMDKKILTAVTKGDFDSFKISYDNIKEFADVFNA